VTGVGSMTAQLIAKRLEILKEAFPHISQIGLLPFVRARLNARAYGFAAMQGMKLMTAQVQRLEDLPAAVNALAYADAWFVQDEVLYNAHPRVVVDVLAKQRKPAIYPHTIFTEVGGLMSYSMDIAEQLRRAASYVDRILRGAKPGELAVEEPTRLELVINMETAKALGLTMPKNFLVRADRVIE
jgi:putative ABC transport system substrate-binding protein